MLYLDITRLYTNSRVGKSATGVDKVSLAYIRQFKDQACAVIRLPNQWLFFPGSRSRDLFEALLNNRSIKLNLYDKKCYTKPCDDANNFVLNTSHSGLESPKYLHNMQKYNLRGMYFLHDIIPIDYPEFCREGEYQKHWQRLNTMLTGDLIIANSQYTFDRFESFCQHNQLRRPTTIWAHIAADSIKQQVKLSEEQQSLLSLVTQNSPYFVILGTIEGRKNHLFLLNLWRDLVNTLGSDCPKLVIIGKRGWECEQVMDVLDRSQELKQAIIELNFCDDRQVNYLIHHCKALLFPSFVEGFGLPLVEAFSQKIPVIANDIPPFQELNIGNAELISTNDGVIWKQKILEYIEASNVHRLNQLEAIEKNYEQLPSWKKHFDKVRPHIDSLLDLA